MSDEPQISAAEWEVMKVLWDHSPITVNDLCRRMESLKQRHPKTIRTMLIRLSKKGVVDTKVEDGIYHYFPTVSREECSRAEADSFLEKVFDGALAPMVAHFVKRRRLTAEERRELKKLLER